LRETIRHVLGRRAALADDILQDAWTEVAHATAYRPGSFRAWLRTIATRKALDRLATVAERRTEGEEAAADVPAIEPGPAAAAQAREGAGLVLDLAERLPEPQRIAWTLRYVDELTFEEIADAMGTPVGTAKTRIRLANAAFAEALDAAGIAPADLAEGRG
jgi:RNA polymerase sigma-70 factor (ECF subfamily)